MTRVEQHHLRHGILNKRLHGGRGPTELMSVHNARVNRSHAEVAYNNNNNNDNNNIIYILYACMYTCRPMVPRSPVVNFDRSAPRGATIGHYYILHNILVAKSGPEKPKNIVTASYIILRPILVNESTYNTD